jgi:DNA mismatch endonuclease (patch repair protein)
MDPSRTAAFSDGSMDTRTPEQRSYIMRSVGTRNTGPELLVRKIIHGLGLRFALHKRDLPGRPDIVLPKHRAIVFVHGCFWHGHKCPKGQFPKSRLDFWVPKIEKNRKRDAESVKSLRKAGWRVLTVWQCETKKPGRLKQKLAKFFDRRAMRKPPRARFH